MAKIIVDAMGGDFAPKAIVDGAIQAVNEYDLKIIFVGIQDQVEAELKKYKYPLENVEVIHAPEVVGMDEPATTSIRRKRNSSITVGMNILKEKNYDAFLSAGNTGAVVCAASFCLGMLPGVERPAIGLVIPTLNRLAFLIDVGANTDPKPEHLLHSALMADIYAKEALGIENPKIGLLNIGSEEGKGTDFAKEAYKLFSERLKNFIGNIEANEVFSGKSDCIVCDGFVGNVVIKVAESVMESAATLIKREVKKSPLAMLGAMLMKSRLNHIKKFADYSEYGSAPLLGVNGLVMISHGRSSPKAVKNALKAAKREIDHNIMSQLREAVR